MRYSLAVLALAVAVQASPFAFPGGVTSAVAPVAKPPPGCTPSHASFGIAVLNISTVAKHKRQVSTISDGQPQAPTSAALISTISDGQPQAPKTTFVPVSTACAATQIVDGQPQACTSTVKTIAHISQITDGQVQGGMHTVTMMPISQISDGQPQGPTITYMPVSVISDGQPQAPKLPTVTACAASQIKDGQPQAGCTITATACAASQIKDGQPQAGCTITACAASQIKDGQPQAGCTITATACAASQIIDGQPQNGCTITSTAKPVSTISEGQPQAPTVVVSATSSALAASSTPYELVACRTSSSLEMSLSNGILTDSDGRTGYIAANYQFQFDKPPQAGAIYTAGFSICANGSLALGGSNVFWQCLSGNFYNLYDRFWAAQCSPITIESLTLISCS